MKMHDREWYAVVCHSQKLTGSSPKRIQFIRDSILNNKVKWLKPVDGTHENCKPIELISRRRYFYLADPDVALETYLIGEDSPRLIRDGRRTRFGYRGYVAISSDSELEGIFLVLLPYAGLAREFWTEMFPGDSAGERDFMKPDIKRLQSLMQNRSPRTSVLRMRLGRVVVTDDSNAKMLTLRGQSILESDLYRVLFKGGAGAPHVSFDDAHVRLGFYPPSMPSTAIFLDRFGNYRIRPGRNGWKAEILIQFVELISRLELLNHTAWCPVSRLSVDGEEGQSNASYV